MTTKKKITRLPNRGKINMPVEVHKRLLESYYRDQGMITTVIDHKRFGDIIEIQYELVVDDSQEVPADNG